jgi:hypothetical protein
MSNKPDSSDVFSSISVPLEDIARKIMRDSGLEVSIDLLRSICRSIDICVDIVDNNEMARLAAILNDFGRPDSREAELVPIENIYSVSFQNEPLVIDAFYRFNSQRTNGAKRKEATNSAIEDSHSKFFLPNKRPGDLAILMVNAGNDYVKKKGSMPTGLQLRNYMLIDGGYPHGFDVSTGQSNDEYFIFEEDIINKKAFNLRYRRYLKAR